MPYLGCPGTQPAARVTPGGTVFISTGMWPCSSATCSSSDMRLSRSSARWSGESLALRQGSAGFAAMAAAALPRTAAKTTPVKRMRIIDPLPNGGMIAFDSAVASAAASGGLGRAPGAEGEALEVAPELGDLVGGRARAQLLH